MSRTPETLLKRCSNQNRPAEMICKKGVLKKIAKFTGKYLFFRPSILLKKRLWYSCFFCEYYIFLETFFLSNTGVFMWILQNSFRFSFRMTLYLFKVWLRFYRIVKITAWHEKSTCKLHERYHHCNQFFNKNLTKTSNE